MKSLSLFNGVSDNNFDLGRAPTRMEAVVILVRVLGKASEAQSGSWTQPFGDVAPWADKYIGYAYKENLAKGVSDTEFGSGNASAATFLTLVLRALGYSDTKGDFSYSDPFTLASSIGLLPEGVDTSSFLRADVVLVSYSALSVKIKGTSQTLAEKLIAGGVFTQAQYENYYNPSAISTVKNSSEMTAEQVYSKCSPAVFYIEVYDADGNATASGSGFFIDSNGAAVTNYHVVKESKSAKITLADTKKAYNVLGVYEYSVDNDWAILKIDGSGFSYLDFGAPTSVVGGATVYAIGSPLGLQNSISNGIISNAARTEDGVTYIQTSAAISHGSSGGALINKYGKVIGITSASYVDGQNLNLALPITYVIGYKTTLLESFADFAVDSQIVLAPTINNVEIKASLTSTSYVVYYGGNATGLAIKSADEKVASVSMYGTADKLIRKLVITGRGVGKTTITVSAGIRHSFDISVTVSTNSPLEIIRKNVEACGAYDAKNDEYYLGATENAEGGETNFFVQYAPNEKYDVFLTSFVDTDMFSILTDIYLIEGSPIAYFDYFYSDKGTGRTISGKGNISKSSFNANTTLVFDSFSGYATEKAKNALLCSTYLLDNLSAAENILSLNNLPLSIGDLGFDTYFANICCLK